MDSAATSQPRASLALNEKLCAWLVLGRVSNLPTVWSNCLAACWLGGWNRPGPVLLLFLGGTLLYTAGMFLNDLCDVEFDSEYRRERPIVSGALNRRAVFFATAGLFVLGIACFAMIQARSGWFALGLMLLIVAYDLTHKRIGLAPILMAGCRFLLYLTAASVGLNGITPRAFAFAIAIGIYVAALSYLARGESRKASASDGFWLLLIVPILFIGDFSVRAVLCCLPLILCIGWARNAARAQIRSAISLLLAGIVLVDLIAISTSSAPLIVVFLVLFGVTLLFQKYVPAS